MAAGGSTGTENPKSPEEIAIPPQVLGALMDALSEGVVVVAPDGTILKMNRVISQLVGGDASLSRKVTCCDVFSHHRSGPEACPVKHYPKGRKGTFEVFFPEYRCYEERVVPLLDSGKHYGFLLCVTDVTMQQLASQERKHLYLQVEESARKVRLAEESARGLRLELSKVEKMATVGRIAGIVFGELKRTSAMMEEGLARLDAGSGAGTDAAVVRELTKAAVRSSHILDKLGQLEIAEAESLIREDLTLLVQEVVEEMLPLADSHGVHLEFLPGSPAVIECNRAQLQAVFSGVILNAIQAEPRREDRILVATGRDRIGAFVVVEDKGPGIALAHLSQVFNPFFTTAVDAHRVGLGLTLCQAIIQSHHGEVEVDTHPDRGTRVKIRIPALTAPTPPSTGDSPEATT